MDCRKGLVLALGLGLGCAGCMTQTQTKVGSEVKTSPPQVTVPLLSKDEKKAPKPETLVAFAKFHEGEARKRPDLAPMQRDALLSNARRSYQAALDADPNSVEAALGLARVYAGLNDHEKALATYQAGLKKHPKDAGLWYGLGAYHARREEYPKAVDCFKKSLELDPNNRECSSTLGYTLVLCERVPEGVEVFRRLYGDEAKAHYRVALMMTWLQKWDRARHHAEQALAKDPTYLNARDMLTRLAQPPAADGPAAVAAGGNPIVNLGFRSGEEAGVPARQ